MSQDNPFKYDEVFFVRAASHSSWLTEIVEKGKKQWGWSANFADAISFKTKKEGSEAWAKMKADRKIDSGMWYPAPQVMTGVDPANPPAKYMLFIATTQGRFLALDHSHMGWVLKTDIASAHIFHSQETAMSVLSESLPKKEGVSAAILPLEAHFLEPKQIENKRTKNTTTAPLDPLACAMFAKSARWELEQHVPHIEESGSAPKKSKRAL